MSCQKSFYRISPLFCEAVLVAALKLGFFSVLRFLGGALLFGSRYPSSLLRSLRGDGGVGGATDFCFGFETI